MEPYELIKELEQWKVGGIDGNVWDCTGYLVLNDENVPCLRGWYKLKERSPTIYVEYIYKNKEWVKLK